ncbi:hypothetical protein [Paenirhodobacter sp.]|uniref:hypothetical protein n=1 Tax=Paenirhodobacter sp. TaxID=1965326 RepID=UPI003B411886
MTTVESARIYARIALLRRRVLLRLALRRAVAGLFAGLALIVAVGFGTRAAYLALLPRLGDLGATAAVGGGYLVVALILAAIALREPASPELDALGAMEEEARLKAMVAARGIGARAELFTGNILTGINLVGLLRRFLRRKS